jgi:hypothetical protein
MGNFYEDRVLVTERAKLAEDISLPESIDDYKNIQAKFYLNIYTPLVDKSNIKSQSKSAPSLSKYNNNNLKPSKYEEVNYITLTIPKYILFQFKEKIPKGTEFIVTNIGELRIEHFRIIGVYTLDIEEDNNESTKTTS